MSDQLVAETSTWQHTTLTTDIHALGGIRTHNLSSRGAADLSLRLCGHWDRLFTYSFFLWRCDPMRVMASSFLRFLDHTQWCTTVGRTPPDEWSARRRDLYLKTHNTHNRQTSMAAVAFELTISAGKWPQTYALDRTATGIGLLHIVPRLILNGAISSHPPYVPMAHTQTTLPFYQHSFLYKARSVYKPKNLYMYMFCVAGRGLEGGLLFYK